MKKTEKKLSVRHSQYLVRRMESSWGKSQNSDLIIILHMKSVVLSQLLGLILVFSTATGKKKKKKKVFNCLSHGGNVNNILTWIKVLVVGKLNSWPAKVNRDWELRTLKQNCRVEILTPVNIKLQGTSMKLGFHDKSQKVVPKMKSVQSKRPLWKTSFWMTY